MNRLFLALLLPLMGCAAFEPPGFGKQETQALSSAEMDAAIRAAKPGEPR